MSTPYNAFVSKWGGVRTSQWQDPYQRYRQPMVSGQAVYPDPRIRQYMPTYRYVMPSRQIPQATDDEDSVGDPDDSKHVSFAAESASSTDPLDALMTSAIPVEDVKSEVEVKTEEAIEQGTAPEAGPEAVSDTVPAAPEPISQHAEIETDMTLPTDAVVDEAPAVEIVEPPSEVTVPTPAASTDTVDQKDVTVEQADSAAAVVDGAAIAEPEIASPVLPGNTIADAAIDSESVDQSGAEEVGPGDENTVIPIDVEESSGNETNPEDKGPETIVDPTQPTLDSIDEVAPPLPEISEDGPPVSVDVPPPPPPVDMSALDDMPPPPPPDMSALDAIPPSPPTAEQLLGIDVSTPAQLPEINLESPVADNASVAGSLDSEYKHVSFAPGTPEPKPTKRKKKPKDVKKGKRRSSITDAEGIPADLAISNANLDVIPVPPPAPEVSILPVVAETNDAEAAAEETPAMPAAVIKAKVDQKKSSSSKSKAVKTGGLLAGAFFIAKPSKSKSKSSRSKDNKKDAKSEASAKLVANGSDANVGAIPAGLGIELANTKAVNGDALPVNQPISASENEVVVVPQNEAAVVADGVVAKAAESEVDVVAESRALASIEPESVAIPADVIADEPDKKQDEPKSTENKDESDKTVPVEDLAASDENAAVTERATTAIEDKPDKEAEVVPIEAGETNEGNYPEPTIPSVEPGGDAVIDKIETQAQDDDTCNQPQADATIDQDSTATPADAVPAQDIPLADITTAQTEHVDATQSDDAVSPVDSGVVLHEASDDAKHVVKHVEQDAQAEVAVVCDNSKDDPEVINDKAKDESSAPDSVAALEGVDVATDQTIVDVSSAGPSIEEKAAVISEEPQAKDAIQKQTAHDEITTNAAVENAQDAESSPVSGDATPHIVNKSGADEVTPEGLQAGAAEVKDSKAEEVVQTIEPDVVQDIVADSADPANLVDEPIEGSAPPEKDIVLVEEDTNDEVLVTVVEASTIVAEPSLPETDVSIPASNETTKENDNQPAEETKGHQVDTDAISEPADAAAETATEGPIEPKVNDEQASAGDDVVAPGGTMEPLAAREHSVGPSNDTVPGLYEGSTRAEAPEAVPPEANIEELSAGPKDTSPAADGNTTKEDFIPAVIDFAEEQPSKETSIAQPPDSPTASKSSRSRRTHDDAARSHRKKRSEAESTNAPRSSEKDKTGRSHDRRRRRSSVIQDDSQAKERRREARRAERRVAEAEEQARLAREAHEAVESKRKELARNAAQKRPSTRDSTSQRSDTSMAQLASKSSSKEKAPLSIRTDLDDRAKRSKDEDRSKRVKDDDRSKRPRDDKSDDTPRRKESSREEKRSPEMTSPTASRIASSETSSRRHRRRSEVVGTSRGDEKSERDGRSRKVVERPRIEPKKQSLLGSLFGR